MLQLSRQEKLPTSLRQTAKLLGPVGFSYSTVRTAAMRSVELASHFKLKSTSTNSILDELVEQADRRTKEFVRRLTPPQRTDLETQLREMPREDAADLLRTLTQDPDTQAALRGCASLDPDEQDPADDEYVPQGARRRDPLGPKAFD